MEKYKIKDLLLIYESGDCRFGVLNNKKTKIKILTKNEIHSIDKPSFHTYMKEDRDVGHFYYVNAYETNDGLKAFPLCGKFEDINANSRAIFRDGDDTCFYRYKQIIEGWNTIVWITAKTSLRQYLITLKILLILPLLQKLKKRLILLNPIANPLLEILKMKDWPNRNAKIKNMQNNMTKH